MNGEERVLQTIERKEPDWVPLDLGGFQSGVTAIALANVRDKLGMDFPIEIMETVQQLANVPEYLLQKFHIDTRYVFPNGIGMSELPGRNAFRDEWGVVWEKKEGCFYFEMVEHPLAEIDTIEGLHNYPFPKAHKEERTKGLREKAVEHHDKNFALFTSISGTLEEAWYLRGLEKFLTDIADNKKYFIKLYEKVMEILLEIYGTLFEAVGDLLNVVEIWGDLTGQFGPMFSPKFYRVYLKPLDKEYISFIKSKTNAHVAWHCCGVAVHYIPDLIDIGVEILKPVQVSAEGMNTKKLKDNYGKDLCFWGGIDTQYVLPRGTTRTVEDEVKRRIEDLAPGGGYISASVHNIQPDVPPENILTMFEKALEFGIYT